MSAEPSRTEPDTPQAQAALDHARRTENWSFDPCCHEAFDEVVAAWEAFVRLGELSVPLGSAESEEGALPSGDLEAIGAALAHGAVVPAFIEEVFEDRPSGPGREAGDRDKSRRAPDGAPPTEFEGADLDITETVLRFASSIVELSPSGAPRAAALVLAAMAAERLGDELSVEKLLIEAIDVDPDCGTAAVELADYCLLRDDMGAALELLRGAPLGNHARLERLEAVQGEIERIHRQAPRNAACPCGSERKYKVCCHRSPQIPSMLKLELLTQKLGSYLTRVHRWHRVVELADRAVPVDAEDGPAAVARLSAHPLIHDLVCFEGGVAAEFLRDRGAFLSSSEAALVERLLATPRALWEVTSVAGGQPNRHAGLAVHLVDVIGGDTITIRDRSGRAGLDPGDRVLGRHAVVDGEDFMAGIPINLPLVLHGEAEKLVRSSPTADDFARWFARQSAVA